MIPVLEAGRPWPLGAHPDGDGINFALFSAHAERVELCLVDADGGLRTMTLPACTDQVWHGYLRGAAPGQRYLYRVHGPADPGRGHRFDPGRLLLDPCARALAGRFSWDRPDELAHGLAAEVVDAPFDWGDDRPPAVPWADSLLYEVHVRGATRRHARVPEALRGTYAGLATPAMIEHYRRLGVTALNLLPVQAFIDEERLFRGGRVNYWGYNPLAFFVPEARYAVAADGRSVLDEFRAMVRTLHAAGIEVILDVVFNHTAEIDETGPTLSFRGIDNASYYRLPADDPARYENFSGCGNTFNLAHPRVLQLVLDALRYWAGEMHVDGFRFDLAAALTRDSAFDAAVLQDPLLGRLKLIAEPWDLGPDGYRLGRFPPGWREWNDRFRDAVRAFWLTGQAGIGELAQRLAGSSEIFRAGGRTPQAGINFITAHDGFTLRDLVSYAAKHNEANGEGNRDGNDHNHSTNCGHEGDSDDPGVIDCRRRLQGALLATLFLAQGVPMLQGGDELGRSQQGNNNAYCQDGPTTWFDWDRADAEQIELVALLAALRRRYPQLRRTRWFDADGEIVWWHPEGRPMRQPDWDGDPAAGRGLLGLCFAAPAGGEAPGPLLCLINRSPLPAEFALPPGDWVALLDSGGAPPAGPAGMVAARSVRFLGVMAMEAGGTLPA